VKNITLAAWLEHCAELIALENNQFNMALFEGVLQAATTGSATMLDSVVNSAARNAVAVNHSLERVLGEIQAAKLWLWERLEGELDPEVAWDNHLLLEAIFQNAVLHATQTYIDTMADMHRRQIQEAARLSNQAEQQVLGYAGDLARANRELARLEKAKTDFISIAAHELKTPLTVIQGYVDILAEQAGAVPDKEDPGVLRGLSVGAERLAAIVDELLDVSAIETRSLALNLEPVLLAKLVEGVMEQVRRLANRRDHNFQIDIPPELPPFITDPKRLHQILAQLLLNAVKFTPDKGRIGLKIYVEAPANGIRFVRCVVSDSGIGIAPEDREHIFDKFYRVGKPDLHSTGRVKFKGAGTGLGLSIVRGIIELLGGQIWAESPGYDEINCPGSTFHIRLPVRDVNDET